jgi:hypothetical protein
MMILVVQEGEEEEITKGAVMEMGAHLVAGEGTGRLERLVLKKGLRREPQV